MCCNSGSFSRFSFHDTSLSAQASMRLPSRCSPCRTCTAWASTTSATASACSSSSSTRATRRRVAVGRLARPLRRQITRFRKSAGSASVPVRRRCTNICSGPHKLPPRRPRASAAVLSMLTPAHLAGQTQAGRRASQKGGSRPPPQCKQTEVTPNPEFFEPRIL